MNRHPPMQRPISSSWLLKEEESLFFGYMVTGRLSRLQELALYLCAYGQQ